ncbi:MAG: FliG C-terminal domain-containing protein [Pseudobdellovibrionaceae bacterium]
MSMLSRFRKPGGFQQLLALIESCEADKQKSLLHLVAQEDPGWAFLVKSKVLTADKIFSWDSSHLMEILPQLPQRVLVAFYCFSDEQKQKLILRSLDSNLARKVQEEALENPAEPGELRSARIKLIQAVRSLEAEGKLRLSLIDPARVLDQRLVA